MRKQEQDDTENSPKPGQGKHKRRSTAMPSQDPLSLLQRTHSSGKERGASRFRRIVFRVFLAMLILGTAGWFYAWINQRGPLEEVEIFEGVWYVCEQMPKTDESDGLAHIVRVDLTAPGVKLFTTPVDDAISEKDWEYQLQTTGSFLRENNLAVAINGAQFSSDSISLSSGERSWPIRLSGDLARSNEMVVSDAKINGADKNHHLLWFDKDQTPHLELKKGPSPDVLSHALWGMGAQSVLVIEGKLRRDRPGEPDARTLIGIDTDRKLLWLAVFEHASPRAAGNMLIEHGAQEAVCVDGGTSSSMVVGPDAAVIRSGTVFGKWTPVATHLGVRARPLQDSHAIIYRLRRQNK